MNTNHSQQSDSVSDDSKLPSLVIGTEFLTPIVKSTRLELIASTLELASAEFAEDLPKFMKLLRASIPHTYPPEYNDTNSRKWTRDKLLQNPSQSGWFAWYWIRDYTLDHKNNNSNNTRVIIGCGGFCGPPDDNDTVEIGYSVVSDYRREGYAFEAVKNLIHWAFQHSDVKIIKAKTLVELTPSIELLKKLGFKLTETVQTDSGENVMEFQLKKQDLTDTNSIKSL